MAINRLSRDGRLVSVALDHGVFGAQNITTGLGDLVDRVRETVSARPDAIQLNLASAERLWPRVGEPEVKLVARLDLTNAYMAKPGEHLYSLAVERGVERAANVGAAFVVVNLLDSESDGGLRRDCIAIINRLRAETMTIGMSLMVEPLVLSDEGSIRYAVNGDAERIAALVRQASELGADFVKADPTDDLDRYGEVIEAAGVPVVVRGGGQVPDDELLDRTERLIRAGASGVVYGRNVFQHPDPPRLVSRLMDVVHG